MTLILCNRIRFIRFVSAVALMVLSSGLYLVTETRAEDAKTPGKLTPNKPAEAKIAEAPRDHRSAGSAPNGHYYAPIDLMTRYDFELDRLKKARAAMNDISVSLAESRFLRKSRAAIVAKVAAEIQEAKVFVPAAKIATKTEEVSFEPGKNRLIYITADTVKVVGWKEPKVKCVITKNVIGEDESQFETGLEKIKIKHSHGKNSELVGGTPDQEKETWEENLARAKAGDKNVSSVEALNEIYQDRVRSNRIFAVFQDQEFDQISIEGLDAQSGNAQTGLLTRSRSRDSKNSNMSSAYVWQRSAEITIYVPDCKAVVVQGGSDQLEASDLNADLILTSRGSPSSFFVKRSVKNLHGSLIADEVPLSVAEDIHGDLTLTLTDCGSHSGTDNANGAMKFSASGTLAEFNFKRIDGNLNAIVGKARLEFEDVKGIVNVRNDYGETRWVGKSGIKAAAHRVISETGTIEFELPADLGTLPLVAVTNYGSWITDLTAKDGLYQSVFNATEKENGLRRQWSGIYKNFVGDETADAQFSNIMRRHEAFDHMQKAILNADRTPGIDLLSRAGGIIILKPEATVESR